MRSTANLSYPGQVTHTAPIGQSRYEPSCQTHRWAAILIPILFMLVSSSRTIAQTQTTWKWTIENVDNSAQFTSLAVDADGNVHLAYGSGRDGYDFKYAFRAAGNGKWFVMTLEKEYHGYATNIAIDRNDNPHICLTPREIKYASWNGKSWHVQVIDPRSGTAEFNCSIAFGADNTPNVTWFQTRNAGNQGFLHIKHANLRDGLWMVRTIDFDRECGKWNSIVLDPQGHPHVAYSVFPPGELKYAVFDGKQWHFTLVDSPGLEKTHFATGMGVSLALNDKEAYFMSFYESPGFDADTRDQGSLKVAHLVDDKWKIDTIDQVLKGQGWAEYISDLGFDHRGFPHISYEDGGALKHAYWDGERWRVQLLAGAAGESTIYSSMKIGPDDTIYISYRDASDGSLRVAVGHPARNDAPQAASVKPSESQP